MLLFALITLACMPLMIGYLGKLVAWEDCVLDAAGSAAEPQPLPEHCNELLVAAWTWYMKNSSILTAGSMLLTGAFFGYYRQRIREALGSTGGSMRSFLLHCCPLTHACALCQEAHATESGGAYGGAPPPSRRMVGMCDRRGRPHTLFLVLLPATRAALAPRL